MKIVDCSDLHLNNATYGRSDRSGLTFRTMDHMRAFGHVVRQCVEQIRPDMLVIAGDVYETPHPASNIREFFNEQVTLLSSNGIRVRILVGNHDCCKFHNAMQPLRPLKLSGVVVCSEPSIEINNTPGFQNTLLYLPHTSRMERQESNARESVLEFVTGKDFKEKSPSFIHPVIAFGHFGVFGAMMNDGARNSESGTVTPADLALLGADYVILGDYHGFQKVPMEKGIAVYSGSLERRNFSDVESEKGFLLYDSEAAPDPEMGQLKFMPYTLGRRFIPVPVSKGDIESPVSMAIEHEGTEGAIVKVSFTGTESEYRQEFEPLKRQIRERLEGEGKAQHVMFDEDLHDPEQEKKAQAIRDKAKKGRHLKKGDIREIAHSIVETEVDQLEERAVLIQMADKVMSNVDDKEHQEDPSGEGASPIRIHGLRMHNFMRYGEDKNIVELDKDASSILALPVKRQQWQIDKMGKEVEGLYKRWNGSRESKSIAIVGLTDGDDLDSNGAGKSTIFEAISYGFFERLVREFINREDRKGVSTTSIVSKINGQMKHEAWVQVLFSADGCLWLLQRGRKCGKTGDHTAIFKLECLYDSRSGELGTYSGRVKTPDKETLAKIIRMDYDTFVNSVMFGQMDTGSFMRGTDKVRKDIMISALQLGVLDKYVEEVRTWKKTASDDLTAFAAQVSVLGGAQPVPIEDLETKRTSLEADVVHKSRGIEAETAAKVLLMEDKLLADAQAVEVKLAAARAALSDFMAGIATRKQDSQDEALRAGIRVARTTSELSAAQKATASLRNDLDKANGQVGAFNMAMVEEVIQLAEAARAAKPGRLEEQKALSDQSSKIGTSLGAAQGDVKRLETEKKGLLSLKGKCDSSAKVKCSSCGSTVGMDHLEKELSRVEKGIQEARERAAGLEDEGRKVMVSLENVNARLVNIEDYLVKESKAHAEVTLWEAKKKDVARIIDDIAKAEAAEASLKSRLEAEVAAKDSATAKALEIDEEASGRQDQLKGDVLGLEKDVAGMSEKTSGLKAKIAEADRNIVKLSADKESAIREASSLAAKIEEAKRKQEALATAKAGRDAKEVELRRIKFLERLFGLNGLPSVVLESYVPLLNSYVAEYLDVISSKKARAQVVMNENREIELIISGELSDSSDLVSGGELIKVKLSLSIGLGLLAFIRSSQTPDFICLDEVLAPVDRRTKEHVFAAIERLKEHFRDIIVISHDMDLLQQIERHIVVHKVNGISQIDRQFWEEVSCEPSVA